MTSALYDFLQHGELHAEIARLNRIKGDAAGNYLRALRDSNTQQAEEWQNVVDAASNEIAAAQVAMRNRFGE
jgi:hypothetical protein